MWVLITFNRQKMLMDNKYLALVQQDTAITPLCRIKAAVAGKSDWPLTLARTWEGRGGGGCHQPKLLFLAARYICF